MHSKSGQVLLIIVMILATVVTIVMAVVFKSTTNTQLTKLEQESNKALVAAEAGLEKAMKKNVGIYGFSADLGLSGYPGIDLTNSNVDVALEGDNKTFISPSIQTDGQYTFYMVGYDAFTQTLGTDYFTGNIKIYFASDGGSCDGTRNLPALEITFVKWDDTNYILEKKLIEECSGSGNYLTGTADIVNPNSSSGLGGAPFSYEADLGAVPATTKLIIVRTLFAGTKIGLESTTGGVNLKPQGRMLTSQVKAYSGVEKKVQLFQSYPQIIADFFVTSF